jgi:hypothetical protein
MPLPRRTPARRIFLSSLARAAFPLIAFSGGCASEALDESPTPSESVATDNEAVLGNDDSITSCNTSEKNHLWRSLYAGRYIARSAGFRQCVDAAMRSGITLSVDGEAPKTIGPYEDCNCTDAPQPHHATPVCNAPSIDQRIAQVMAAATSTSDLTFTCTSETKTGTGGFRIYMESPFNDSTLYPRNGIPYWPNAEPIQVYQSWRDDLPPLDTGTPASSAYANSAVFQLPRATTAGFVWHEVMHNWGYNHPVWGQSCGSQQYSESVPDIVNTCMRYTIANSRSCANDCLSGSGRRKVRLFGSSACECVDDPSYDVGVIPDVGSACPGEELTIRMDGEDDDNMSTRSGWIGRTESSSNTIFKFCRVPGSAFVPRVASTSTANYGVLRMGRLCPNGSQKASVYWDNEDDDNGNWSTGHVAPSSLTSNTRLEVCVFPASSTAANTPFPTDRMPSHYGVFGTDQVPGVLDTGFVRADGEHDDNNNSFSGFTGTPFFYTKSFYIDVRMAKVR